MLDHKEKRNNINNEKTFLQIMLAYESLHKTVSVALIVMLCAIISYLYLSSTNKIGEIYQNETKATVVELKKVFLKSTIDNLIQELEEDRTIQTEHYRNVIDRRYDIFKTKSFKDDNFVSEIITDLGLASENNNMSQKWTVFIWRDDNTVLYDSTNLFNKNIPSTIENIKPLLSHYRIFHYGDKACIFGISKNYIDSEIKEAAARKIKKLKFENDSYIWVNEILNYNGGENYAIRRIHPNLPDTEGMYLSTDMKDIKGNFPYLIELEGVKKDGELFFNYYFKELNSDNISEKLTYAKLYDEYDWIIAMGVQNNEIDKYIAKTNEEFKSISFSNSLKFLSLLLAMVLLFIMIIVLIEQWRLKHSKKLLVTELQFDALTNAKSRRFGNEYLEKMFNEFQSNTLKPDIAIMLFDIDNFKSINDCYGHCVGDLVLKEFVPAVYKTIRNSDELFRWGGDEFIGVFYGTNKENAFTLAEKILETLSSLKLEIDSELIRLSISIGISHFQDDDQSFTDALKRADKAMYMSKAEGGNTVKQL
mgnify:CR=1 FL=1|jgi:diguanylate cyclase (GGDEF)-like protein